MVGETRVYGANGDASPEDSNIKIVGEPHSGDRVNPKPVRNGTRKAPPRLAGKPADAPGVDSGPSSRDAKRRLEAGKKLAIQRVIYPPDDDEFECSFPQLWEGLTMSTWGDGVPRLPWTITIKRIPGAYQVKITDDDLLQYTLVDCAEWEGIRQALELKLLSSNPGWQPMDKSYKNKKGLRKFDKKA